MRITNSEAMSRLLAWVDGIGLPMFLLHRDTDHQYVFLHSNQALANSTGLTLELLRGKQPSDIFPARLADLLIANYHAGFESEAPISFEQLLEIDGRESWWQTTLSKPEGFADQVLLGVSISITQHKTREFLAAQRLADLSAQFDELKLFSTMAAHDARSPLATVSNLIDLVMEDFQDKGDGKTELLVLVSKTVTEALDQITSTLRRGQSIKLGQQAETRVDLGRLCGDIAAMVDPGGNLRIELPQGLFDTDEVLLQMALRNLIANAARFARTRIVVEVSDTPSDGFLTFHVGDDGPGLCAGTSVAALTRKARETDDAHGYGLASIAQLVATRGGAFDMEPGEAGPDLPGAVFRLTLPGRRVTQDAGALAMA